MRTFLRRYAEFVVAHAWLVLLASLLVSAVMGVSWAGRSTPVCTSPAADRRRADTR